MSSKISRHEAHEMHQAYLRSVSKNDIRYFHVDIQHIRNLANSKATKVKIYLALSDAEKGREGLEPDNTLILAGIENGRIIDDELYDNMSPCPYNCPTGDEDL